MPVLPTLQDSTFDADLRDRHLVYDYAAHDAHGNPQKWRYELWFCNEDRAATYQCIRPGELWQCNWLEETGTVVSLVYDIPWGRITTMLGFSRGHWENAEAAHGDKSNAEDLERWRELARIGIQTERHVLSEQADVLEVFRGPGQLGPVEMDWPTL
ncbi:Calycin-like protein [Thermoascus aurantiacus ATCC 26904]